MWKELVIRTQSVKRQEITNHRHTASYMTDYKNIAKNISIRTVKQIKDGLVLKDELVIQVHPALWRWKIMKGEVVRAQHTATWYMRQIWIQVFAGGGQINAFMESLYLFTLATPVASFIWTPLTKFYALDFQVRNIIYRKYTKWLL